MTLDLGEQMSNLYMTTTEFAALVVNALDEQNYFKKDAKAHPDDIASAFATISETIGSAMSWAISKEHEVKQKQAVMRTTTLAKNNYYTDTTSASKVTFSPSTVLPTDDEIAPVIEDVEFDYSEWKYGKKVQ